MEQAAVIAVSNPAVVPSNLSEKSRLVALLFCILLGFLAFTAFMQARSEQES